MAKIRITALERVSRINAEDLLVLVTDQKTKIVTFLDFNIRLRVPSS